MKYNIKKLLKCSLRGVSVERRQEKNDKVFIVLNFHEADTALYFTEEMAFVLASLLQKGCSWSFHALEYDYGELKLKYDELQKEVKNE